MNVIVIQIWSYLQSRLHTKQGKRIYPLVLVKEKERFIFSLIWKCARRCELKKNLQKKHFGLFVKKSGIKTNSIEDTKKLKGKERYHLYPS